ncbi:hypothetical protein H7170_03465 [Candidatus Gracilibacteria bacterium]|nr:hypothetical protein [Candidatus Gracilibacteria bacterium]
MRARLLAFLILILLVAVPAFAYYYFTSRSIASLNISSGSGVVFTARLAGSFGVDGLPLADRALSYSQACISQCHISPILPARYTLTLMSSGQTDISDTLIINTADKITRSYLFTRDVMFTIVDNIADIADISSGSTWHTRTQTGSYIRDGEKEIEDIRFTDAIDLTPDIRLGYIDQKDTTKLSIGNFPLGQSVLIRLDRTTGESVVVRKGLEIGAFVLYRNTPAYIESSGQIYTITY